MSEQQPIPQAFLESFEDNHALAEFCTWSDDFFKDLVLASSESPLDSTRMNSPGEANDSYALLYQLKELRDEASRLKILPEVVEYARTYIEFKGESVPMSFARVIVRDVSLAPKVVKLANGFMKIAIEIVESKIDIRELGTFMLPSQNN